MLYAILALSDADMSTSILCGLKFAPPYPADPNAIIQIAALIIQIKLFTASINIALGKAEIADHLTSLILKIPSGLSAPQTDISQYRRFCRSIILCTIHKSAR